MDKEKIYTRLIGIAGKESIKKDDLNKLLYSHDVASLPEMFNLGFKMKPDFIVKPLSAEQISKIIKLAIKQEIPIIPRGGASWGLGGAVPIDGGIVLDMNGMDKILEIDSKNLIVKVETGVTWKELYDELDRKNLFLGAYPSSAPSATIGGWINTGGVGIGSYKYGSARDMIRNMEVVLPTGEVINTGFDKVLSNSAGYDLNSLFIGAEGTLGVITKVTLKVTSKPKEIRPLTYTFAKLTEIAPVVQRIVRENITPLHLSFFGKEHFDLLSKLKLSQPPKGAVLNIVLEGASEILNYEEALLDKIITKKGGKKADKKLAKHEWAERYYEMRTKRLGPSAILAEGFVPISEMGAMVEDTYALFSKLKLRGAITGMISDRNTAVFMPYYLSDERKFFKSVSSLSFVKKLGDLAFKHGGRPAGLGLFYAVNLKKLHGPGMDLIYDIKDTLDPHEIMNPGKLIEGRTRYGVPIPPIGMKVGMGALAALKRIIPGDKEK
jgi:glycolate oxidase